MRHGAIAVLLLATADRHAAAEVQKVSTNADGSTEEVNPYEASGDSTMECYTWAADGQCVSNPGYMHSSCKYSCFEWYAHRKRKYPDAPIGGWRHENTADATVHLTLALVALAHPMRTCACVGVVQTNLSTASAGRARGSAGRMPTTCGRHALRHARTRAMMHHRAPSPPRRKRRRRRRRARRRRELPPTGHIWRLPSHAHARDAFWTASVRGLEDGSAFSAPGSGSPLGGTTGTGGSPSASWWPPRGAVRRARVQLGIPTVEPDARGGMPVAEYGSHTLSCSRVDATEAVRYHVRPWSP